MDHGGVCDLGDSFGCAPYYRYLYIVAISLAEQIMAFFEEKKVYGLIPLSVKYIFQFTVYFPHSIRSSRKLLQFT